jgi:predicted ester cyclase
VKVEQIHTMRIKDGKVVEMWMMMDKLDFMTQLGVLPSK